MGSDMSAIVTVHLAHQRFLEHFLLAGASTVPGTFSSWNIFFFDAVEIESFNDPVELLLRIVPENNPLVFFVVDFAQGFVELFGVHSLVGSWRWAVGSEDRNHEIHE